MRARDRVSTIAGLVALALSIFALGGAPRWAQAAVAGVAAVALLPLLPSRRVLGRGSPLLAMLGIATALTALQLVPLPHAIVALLDPIGSSLRDDGTALVGVDAHSTLTLDTPGSLRALAFFLVLLAFALVAVRTAGSERGRFRILASVALACGIAAAVVGIHAVVGASELYGIYKPLHTEPHLLGPLINENHLGCLMAVGAVVAAGLVAYPRQPVWLRALWLVIVGACGTATLATLSRGAFFALIAGGVVVTSLLLGQRVFGGDAERRTRAHFITRSLPVAVVAACAVVIVLYASAGGIAEQLSHTTLQELNMPRTKFAAWRSAILLVEETPWIGVGRGAFEAAFTHVHPASAFSTFSHVENEYIQAAIDWGVPGALALGAAAVWFLVVAVRRWRDGPLAAAALGALAVVALQSNVDFGVELLAIALPMTAIAATLAYVPLRDCSPRTLRRARAIRGGHVAALLVTGGLLLSASTTSIDEDHRQLVARRPLLLDDVRAAIARHPLDYYAYWLAADVMLRDGDRTNAIRVLNHALVLHPTEPGLHLLAARLLYSGGHVAQAAIEYALAARALPDRRRLVAEIATRFPTELAAVAIPTDDPRLDETVTALQDFARPDVAVAWLERVIDHAKERLHACDLLFGLAVARADARIYTTVGQRCRDFEPTHEARLALARVLAAKHHDEEVLQLLADVEAWDGRVDDKVDGWIARCEALRALGRWDDAKHCLRKLAASGALPPGRSADVAQRLHAVDLDHAARDAPH